MSNDGITESWICVDCGLDTAPGIPDGRTMRENLERDGESPSRVGSDSEVYAVRKAIWKKAGMEPFGGCLCIGCLETRLGRKLKPKDFHRKHPFHSVPGTARLLNRRDRP